MRCPACGEENPERARFCLQCGTALVQAGQPASRESRRTVTVVFADMVGFTSLGESLDQESLRRVMDRFYGEMRGAIEAQDGTLAKFIGDAVLAVWGTPEVREDDALRAVRAADAMRGALAGLNEDLENRWGVRVGMRTGVNTGEVVVDPARPADLLVGDTLNVAARLEQAAADGEVLVGADTYRLVRDEVVLEPVEPLALKGKARPLPAWRLVDAERRKATRLQAPLVGREEELAALRAALGAVTAGRACRMTTVIGSPGLGKTRLVAEFIRSVGDDATVLHGRCQATGEGITFQPVAEALRGAADIDDDDTPETARAKLGAVLPGDEPDRDRVIERAAGLLGLAPAATAEETFWAVRRILEALARERPVVLVHDDIHWGQPTFLDLLEHFIEWIRDAPVFVLALARPELREVRPGLAEPGESTDVIALEPLDAEASRAMVSGLLGAADLPEGLARRVLETTEGNPLFLGETLRMLADEGVLRREGDTWVAGDVTDVTVPPTINALLSARIERLGAEERSVVERAAVIGHAFYRGAVTELSPPAIRPGVDGALETLSRKEMVRPEDEWWLDEQVFRFHHVLIRDAAYRSLLKEARAELHERFAAWLEAKAGGLAGEHEEVIAFHLEQSHAYRLELGPLDEPGRELAARAAARLHSAGRRALAREDLPAAENLLRRALAPLAADQAGRLHVLVDLAEALLSAGDTGAAEDVVEELGLGADELGDERLRAWAVVFAAQLDNLTGAGHVRDTASAAGAAAESLAAAADRAGEAKAHQVVAQAEALLGQVAAAEAALDRALVAARAADDRRRITAVLSGAPRAALWGPAPIVRASGRCLDVVRILRMTPGNRHVEAAALRSQAVLEAMRGRAEAARGILDTCRMTLEELGLTLELHETGVHAGIVELLAGDPAAAEQHLLAAHDGFRALGVEGGAAQAAALLARALLDQGRDAEAVEQTRVAEEHGGEDLKTTIAWLGVRAEAVARRGEHDEALGLARRAVALAEPTDALADKADALMALAAVEAAAGDETSARAAAGRARELYAAKDHTVGMRRAEAIAGRAQDEPAGEAPAPGAAEAEARPSPGATGPEAAAMRAWEEAFAAHDWARLREFYAPDVVLRDHRTGLRHEVRGREAVLDVLRGALPIHAEVRQQLLLAPPSPHAMTLRWILGGVNEDGSEWEVVQDQVMAFDSLRRIVLIEVMDDRRALLRRFDELSGVAPTPLVHRTAARCCAAVNGREWDTLAALLAPGSTVVDRRAARVQEELGADELGRVLRSCADGSPDLSCELTPVGAGGELVGITLGVVTGTHASGDRFELRALGVAELDDDGRPRRVVVFDEPDAEAARRLMREWARGHALAIPPWVPAADAAAMAMERWTSAFNAQDVDGMAAMIAPDFVAHDHRPGIRHSMDGNEWLGVWRWLFETVPDVRVEVLVLQSRPDAVHARMRFASDASDYEILMDAVSALCDGRTTLVESFEAGDPAAVALFAERPSAERRPVRLAREWAEAFNAREWDRAVALLAPLYATDDRRPLGIGYVQGPAEGVQAVRSIAEVGPEAVWSFATLESGEHAGLFECTIEGRPPDGGGFSAETLMVIAAGRRGIVRRSVFDPDQREQALAEYRAWAAHGAQLAGFEDAVNRHDFAAIRDHLAPDFRQEDRRRLGASVALDAEAFVEMMRTSERLMPSMAAQLDVVAVVADRRVTRMLYTGRAAGEGEVEVELWTVTRMHDGRMSESVLFESREEAEAALRAAPGGDQTTWKEHEEAVRATVRAWASRDPEAIRALLHHDFTQRDLRASGVSPPAGVEAFVEVARSIWSLVPDLAVEQRVVAVVGPRRVARAHWSGHLADGGGAMDLEFFILAEVRDGRLLSNELYDTEAAAMAALHAGGEADPWAAAHAEHARRYGELWSPDTVEKAVPEFYARDMRLVDHRPIGTMGDLDYAGYLEQMRSMAGTMEAADAVLDVVATEGPVRLARSVVRGLAVPERSPFEMETWYVTRLDGAGRISEQHFFGGEADAREWWLREVAGAAGRDWAAIHAEHSRRSSALYDPQASESVLAELFAPGFRLVDHRPLGTFGDVDLQGFREQVTSVIGVATGVATQVEVPRIEGRRRLARLLVRGGSPETGADSWEAEAWNVVTLDDAGRAVRIDVFGEQAEADAWLTHAAGLQAFEDALNSGRDEEVRRVITEDFRQRDRRQVSADEVDADGFVGMLRSARELVEDMHVRFELVAVRGARRVGRSVYRGSEPQGGGEIALEFWSLSTMREGRTAASDLFDNPDEALEALRQLDEPGRLAPDAAVARGSGSVQAVYDRMTRAFNARDWEGLEQCIGDGFRWTDHRAGLRDEAGDRDGFMVVMRAMAGRGDVRWTYDVIDQAPGRELVRVTLAGSFHGGPFEVRALDLHVLGPDGRFASADIFDEHDEAAARAVWAQQSAAAPHPLERFFRAHAAAVADRDFDRLSELLSEEYTLVSHQSGKRETRHGREEGVLARRAAVEVAGLSGVSNEVELLETRGERLGLARATWRGEFHGGPFEVTFVAVVELDAEGRLLRDESYDVADLDRARARLDEIASRDGRPGDGSAAALLASWTDAVNRGDRAAMGAFFAEDFVHDDHRPGMRHTFHGHEAQMANWGIALGAVPDLHVTARVVREAGPVLLLRITISSDEQAFEIEQDQVSTLRGGLVERAEVFEAGDPAATARFEALAASAAPASNVTLAEEQERELREPLSAAGREPAGPDALAPLARVYAAMELGFNECDWTQHDRVLREDYRWVDLRPGLRVETTGREAFVDLMRTIREGNDLRWIQTPLEEGADGRVGLARVVQTGTYRGGPYEISFLVINALDDEGRGYLTETVADDLPEGHRRLEEVALHHGISNRGQDLINARDFDGLRELVHEDFRQEDHRELGAEPIVGREAYVAMLEDLVRWAPDTRLRMEVIAVAGDHRVTRQLWSGHGAETGAAWESELWAVNTVRDGRSARAEVHSSEEDARAALARGRDGPLRSPPADGS